MHGSANLKKKHHGGYFFFMNTCLQFLTKVSDKFANCNNVRNINTILKKEVLIMRNIV